MSLLIVGCLQALLAMTLDGNPVRFGVPLPGAAVARGLRLDRAGVLQWRRLPVGGPTRDPVWVEIAVAGVSGRVQLLAGGAPACEDRRGPAFVFEEQHRQVPHGREHRVAWRWCSGAIDEQLRTEFTAPTIVGGENYSVGEARSVLGGEAARRADALCTLPRRLFVGSGLLPPAGGLGAAVRKQIAAALPFLHEMPGARGAGDFQRSGAVVTNLEYDTTLALLRCSLAFADAATLAMAARCAQHLRDRDLDPRTGLPFPHGVDHRTGVPEPGHVWLQGLLWVGLLTADDGHIAAARSIASALAATPPRGDGPRELARDFAWPLQELEAWLAVEEDRVVAQAADRLALAIRRRFDPAQRTFRFGEGEVGPGVYLERAWITGGLVLPALQAHLRRRANDDLAQCVHAAQQALLDRIGAGRPGLPTHWRSAGGETFAEHRARGDAAALMLLEGLVPADRRRLLRRETLQDAMAEILRPDDPDLPTKVSLVARCAWVWQ